MYFQKEIKFWLIYHYNLCFQAAWFARYSLFWFFNPFKYLPVNLFLVFWQATLVFMLVLGHVSTCIFKPYILVFCRNCFCLVNSESGVYLVVDQNLVYNYPKMFLLFFSLILGLIPGLNPSFLIHVSVSFLFGFLLLDLASRRIEIMSTPFPSL